MSTAEDALVMAMARAMFDLRDDDAAAWDAVDVRHMHHEDARAALAALRAQGVALVPANGPTADMAIAWGAPAGFFGGWRAMLAASPYAPPGDAP